MAGGEHHTPEIQEEGTWRYQPEGSAAPADTSSAGVSAKTPTDESVIEWTASEFIAHDKGIAWYLILTAVTVAVAAMIYLFTGDVVSVVVAAIAGILFGVTAARKPRIVAYRLDRGGLSIGKQFHPYGNFKSFAVVDEGAFSSIALLPLKRFNLPMNIYFSPEDEQEIMEMLSKRLPLQPGELDTIDTIMRSIHF